MGCLIPHKTFICCTKKLVTFQSLRMAQIKSDSKEEEKTENNSDNDINKQFDKKPVDFSGYWETYKFENSENFINDLDLSWMLKKIAKLMMKKTVYFKIKQNNNKMSFTIAVMMKQQTESFTIDNNKTEYEFKDLSGDKLKCRYAWNKNKTILITKFINVTKKQTGIDRKYIINDPEIGKCIVSEITNEKGTVMKQYWKQSNSNKW